jgi:hypothetical protein
MEALALESIETSPIEHLFISDGPAHIECGANATEGCAAADDGAAFSKCVKDILVYASCSLKSLTIVLQPPSICSTHSTKPHRHLVQIPTGTSFPHLTSLTLCDPGKYSHTFAPNRMTGFPFPAIRTLTLGLSYQALLEFLLVGSVWLTTWPSL